MIRAGLNTVSSFSRFWRLDSKVEMPANSGAGEGLVLTGRRLPSCVVMWWRETSFSERWPPTILAPGTNFVEDSFSTDRGGGWFQMSQMLCIYCALYFYYYDISSTSDHQALDPGGWGPLLIRTHSCWFRVPP